MKTKERALEEIRAAMQQTYKAVSPFWDAYRKVLQDNGQAIMGKRRG